MNRFGVIVLAILTGAGMVGASLVLSAQVDDGSGTGAADTQSTISPSAAAAWKAIERQEQRDPVARPQEQPAVKVQGPATVKSFGYRAPTPLPPTASPPQNPVNLARALQRELTRAGCYRGEINGQWTPATRRAMQAFTDRANAKLPLDQPDPVLLALLKGDPHLGCRDDRAAVAPQPVAAPTATAPRDFSEPPMALAGPKAEADGLLPVQEPALVAPKRQAGAKQQPTKRPARTVDWAAKLWRNPPN